MIMVMRKIEGNETTSSSSVSSPSSLQEMGIAKVKIGEWVVVQYEGEHFIGKVIDTLINKECKEAKVNCLKKTYRLNWLCAVKRVAVQKNT